VAAEVAQQLLARLRPCFAAQQRLVLKVQAQVVQRQAEAAALRRSQLSLLGVHIAVNA
jgi:hypothetical protein